MTMRKLSLGLATAAVVAFAAVGAANAGVNLLSNGGFETGDLSSWSLTGDTSFTGVGSGLGNSGSFEFFSGSVAGASLSQPIVADAGSTLDISAFLASVEGATPNDFQIILNGVVLLDVSDTTSASYGSVSASGTAIGGGSDTVTFAFTDAPGFLLFDDASVTEATVPEPATLAVLGAGLAAFGFYRRRK